MIQLWLRLRTGAVTDMTSMFAYTRAFNQPLGSWNTTAVKDMSLGTRVVPLFLLCFEVSLFKVNISRKDTLVIKGLLGKP